jgi:hypothetical protein
MKTGRNDPCPCGSGKKYKHCCMDAISKQRSALLDDISHVTAMNPNLTNDELNLVIKQKAVAQNNRPSLTFVACRQHKCLTGCMPRSMNSPVLQ